MNPPQAGHSASFGGVAAASSAHAEEMRSLQVRLDKALECIERLESFVHLLEEKLLERDWRYRDGPSG